MAITEESITDMPEVNHIPSAQKFILVENEKESHLFYEMDRGNLNLVRTFVPEEERGHGLGEKLVLAAFKFAMENGKKVIPSCGYVARYMEKHPEWEPLRA